MAKDQTISKRLEQVDYQKAESVALQRLLVVSEGTFSLSIAVCNSPALRDHIIERIKTHADGITIIKIEKEVKDIFEFVKRKTDGEIPSAIFIIDIEKAIPDSKDPKVLRALNVTRELWKANYSCPIVFWVPEYVATLISRHAPDLWSWISHHFEFVSEQAGAIAGKSDIYAGDISLAGSLDLDEKQFRIAELEQRIKDAGEPPKEDIAGYVTIWLNELGYIYYAIGELDKAEEMLNKSLQIDEKLGQLEGMASDYGNLGLIYRRVRKLNKSEEMHSKALEIGEKLGLQNVIAAQYGSLGLIYQMKGDLDKAEHMHNKALEISEKLGLQKIMASQYGNLGIIYRTRGELDKAEEMFKKALEIHKNLSLHGEMASDYGNLGLIYKDRGEFNKAEEMYNKALNINEKLGLLTGMASDYGNLGLIYQTRGNLDKAEEMHRKALEIAEKLGLQEGMASDYGNLGAIYITRGELDKAEEMHQKALMIAEKLGLQEIMANQYGNLGLIYKERGDTEKARQFWEKARDLFKRIGMPHQVKKMEERLEGLHTSDEE